LGGQNLRPKRDDRLSEKVSTSSNVARTQWNSGSLRCRRKAKDPRAGRHHPKKGSVRKIYYVRTKGGGDSIKEVKKEKPTPHIPYAVLPSSGEDPPLTLPKLKKKGAAASGLEKKRKQLCPILKGAGSLKSAYD